MREIELDMDESRVDWEGVTEKLRGYVSKLKGLQILTIYAFATELSGEIDMPIEALESWVYDIFPSMIGLQEVNLGAYFGTLDEKKYFDFQDIKQYLKENEKYQKISLGS